QRPVRRREDEVRREVPADLLGVGVLTRPDRLHEVALGDDPGPRRVRIQHHRGADLALGHEAGGLAQRVLRPDGEDHGAHPVTYLHATHSSLFSLATFAAMSTLAASENNVPPALTQMSHGAPTRQLGKLSGQARILSDKPRV